jgi:hypothetical protein
MLIIQEIKKKTECLKNSINIKNENTHNFSGLQGGETGRAKRGTRAGGIDHDDERPTVSKVVRRTENVLRRRKNFKRFNLTIFPRQNLLWVNVINFFLRLKPYDLCYKHITVVNDNRK